jgi:hypothetical protein
MEPASPPAPVEHLLPAEHVYPVMPIVKRALVQGSTNARPVRHHAPCCHQMGDVCLRAGIINSTMLPAEGQGHAPTAILPAPRAQVPARQIA